MMNPRIDFLEKSLSETPGDPFLRYALAMELSNGGRLEEASKHFEKLIEESPDYSATYYQAGMLLARLGRAEEAKGIFSRGVEITRRQGNQHALGELQAALDDLASQT